MIPTRLNWPIKGGVVAGVVSNRNTVSLVILNREFVGSAKSCKVVNKRVTVTKNQFMYMSAEHPGNSWRLPTVNEAAAVIDSLHVVDRCRHILDYTYFNKWFTSEFRKGASRKHDQFLKWIVSRNFFEYENSKFGDVFLVKSVTIASIYDTNT